MWDLAIYQQLRAEGKFDEADTYLCRTWPTHPADCNCIHCGSEREEDDQFADER